MNRKEYLKKWKEDNRERILKYGKDYREKNREKRKIYYKEWYKENSIERNKRRKVKRDNLKKERGK